MLTFLRSLFLYWLVRVIDKQNKRQASGDGRADIQPIRSSFARPPPAAPRLSRVRNTMKIVQPRRENDTQHVRRRGKARRLRDRAPVTREVTNGKTFVAITCSFVRSPSSPCTAGSSAGLRAETASWSPPDSYSLRHSASYRSKQTPRRMLPPRHDHAQMHTNTTPQHYIP